MHRARPGVYAWVVAACAFVASACGPSADEAKQAAALQRVANRPKPGFVRLINLSQAICKLLDGQRPLSGDQLPGSASTMVPVGAAKDRDLVIQGTPGVFLHAKVNVEPGTCTSIVLLPDGKSIALGGNEPRKANEEENLAVVALDHSGKAMTVRGLSLKSGATSIPLDKDHLLVPAGDYTLAGITGVSPTLKVEPKYAYSIVLVESKAGQYQAFALVNSDTTKPAAAGAS